MKAIQTIGVSLALLMLITACENPISGTNSGKPAGNVIIKIAGSDGRTVLPSAPVFSKFELTLQKEGEDPIQAQDTSGITGAGTAVQLTEGNWTITLNAYQDVLKNGEPVLAAKGSATVEVQKGDRLKTVFITLDPLAIGESAEPGVFSYTITLPDVDTAALSLKNSNGSAVNGYDALDLTDGNNLSRSIALAAGYYDLSVILTKNGQSAGTFETIHIYSGLESPLTLNLSTVAFANKVYIVGTLGGIRLGTVKITSNAGAILNTLELDGTPAVRSANWIIDIPSEYAGQTVYAVQEFNGITSAAEAINVPLNGITGIPLSLIPAATPELFNVALWYSELTASGGNNLAQAANGSMSGYWQSDRDDNGSVWLELDFGFNVSVNASRLIFYSENDSVFLDEYTVEYWDGGAWIEAANREQHFSGSTDGSVRYSNFFATVTASKFKWKVPSVDDTLAVIEFGLYNAVDRSALSTAIAIAQDNHDITDEDTDGKETEIGRKWVTAAVKQTYQNAIVAAQAACDDPLKSSGELSAAKNILDEATAAFNNAKKDGESGNILVNGFSVQDGYADKFVIKWEKEPHKKYKLSISSDNVSWQEIAVFDIDLNSEDELKSYPVTGIPAGTTRYFAIQAFRMSGPSEIAGQTVFSTACMTLGVPALTLANSSPSYRTVSLSWTAAQKADTYRIIYSFAGDATSPHSVEAAISDLTKVGDSFTYSFRPTGYDNPQITGRKLDIYIEALNKALWNEVGGPAFYTTSNTVETRLVGPAELNASATQAASADSIALSWSPVEGAGGYYVYRRQFNMTNTAEAAAAIAYYVDGSGLTVTGKGIGGDTSKASAAFANDRFTLTDSWMTDSEYTGAYNGYAANYKDQQNDMAKGNAYRYFIVPVIAETDTVTFNASGNNVAYTIGDVTYSNAASFEKTGFTLGFAQNVTATKGTYASTGNVNDGIQITWEAPPLLASTGVTPQYTVWRKAYNETTWSYDPASVTDASYNDNPVINSSTQRGIVYEYAVGINGSRPIDSSRFINASRAHVDGKGVPNGYGYMLDMVKMDSVSRNVQQDGNGSFGEVVNWLAGGVKNGGSDANWGIDGYTVYVMNRNVNGNWHIIADDVAASLNTKLVTTGMGSFNGMDLLKVLRDYKHYFKVRSYALNETGVKVYCPDPVWNFETLFAANRDNQDDANFLQTDYVKWGARQITTTEFTKVATLFLAWGIHATAGSQRSSWTSTLSAYWTNTNGNNGSSGRIGCQTSAGVGKWWFYPQNYKPDLDTNANRGNWTYSTTFVTIDSGTSTSDYRIIYGDSNASSQFPQWYGRDSNYGSSFCDIKGPTCVAPLYTGQIRFNSFSWTGGNVEVKYPTSADAVQITNAQANTPLPFQQQEPTGLTADSRRYTSDAWY